MQLRSSSLDTFFIRRSASSFDFDEEGDFVDERNETHHSCGGDVEQEDDHPYTCTQKSKLVAAPAAQDRRFEIQLQENRETEKKC